jgi:pyrroloquinoline quinone biosynthesis protein D
MSIHASAVPSIAHGFRLQWEPTQNAHVLLYPEGMVQLNDTAGEILKRCDGATPVSAIVSDLEARFEAQNLTPDVIAFLDIATRQGWVQTT